MKSAIRIILSSKPNLDLVKIQGNTGLKVNVADGINALVNGRSSTATIIDFEGIVKNCLVGELRFSGGRRIHNIATASTIAVSGNMTLTLADGDYRFTMGAGASGGVATFSGTGGATGTLTQNAISRTSVLKTITAGTFIITASVADLTQIIITNVTYQSNQNPPEYIDYNTIYNAGVPGVYYSDRYNGNTVASNIVTEAQGALLPTVPVILNDPASTNLDTYWDGNLSTYAWIDGCTNATTPIIGFTNSIQFGDNSVVRAAYKGAASTNGVTYSFSFFVKMDDNSIPSISNQYASDFAIQANNSTLLAPYAITHIGNNVYLVLFTFVGNGSAIFGPGVLKYTQQSSKSFKITGFQLEQRGSCTSPIPTTTAAVSRSADSIKLPLVLDSNFKQTKGIILHKVKMLAASTAVNNAILSFNTGVTDFVYSNDGSIYLSDGTNTASVNISGYAVNDVLLIGVAYNDRNGQMSLHVSKNGGAWVNSANTPYDSAFPVGANILFANANTDSMQILFSNIIYTRKNIAQMQNFIKINGPVVAA